MAKTAKVFSLLLRLVATAASAAAAVVMATSHENRTFFNIQVHAKYHHTPAFKVFVIANAIAAGYSFLVLFLPSKSSLRRLVLVLDVVVTMLLTGAISAALAVGYIGKKGNSYAGWLPICNQLSKFCDHVTVAMIIGFGSAFIYLSLLLHTIHTVLNPLIP